MKNKLILPIFVLMLLMTITSAFADTNYNNTAMTITDNTDLWGTYYNISTLTVLSNVTVNVSGRQNASYGGYLIFNATNIYVFGNITGDGMGYAGGGGSGGGGGGANSGSGGVGGSAGTSIYGTNGNIGDIGSDGTGASCGGTGGTGGTGLTNVSGPSGGYGGCAPTESGSSGSTGNNALTNADGLYTFTGTLGNGGSGGAGGGGAASFAVGSGAGAGGSGAGGYGGGYLVLNAKTYLYSNGTFNFRSGQLVCANGATGGGDGGSGSSNGGNGGNGGSNTGFNCLPGSGANGGSGGYAGEVGGNGATGGYGAGGSVVFAAAEVNIKNAKVNVSGGSSNGGTIKTLYTTTLVPGNYSGQSQLTSGTVNNTFLESRSTFQLNLTAIQKSTGSPLTGLNYTIVDSDGIQYSSNNTALTTTVFNLPNQTYNITVIKADGSSISNSTTNYALSSNVSINYTLTIYPTVQAFIFSPSNMYGLENEAYNVTFYNPNAGTTFINATKWYKNGVYNSSLDNLTVLPANYMNSGDNWTLSLSTYDGIINSVYTNYSFYLPNITVYIQGVNPLLGNNLTNLNITINKSGVIWSINNTIAQQNFFNLSKGVYYVNIKDNNGVFTFSANDSFNTTTNPQFVSLTFQKTVVINIFDEFNGGPFNISHPTNLTIYSTCINGSQFQNQITSNVFTIPYTCPLDQYYAVLTYANLTYYSRKLLANSTLNPYNVSFYLSDLNNTNIVLVNFAIDNQLGTYGRPISLWLKRTVANKTVTITSDYVDISDTLNFYLQQGATYTVEVHSSNQPVLSAGAYTATSSVQNILRLFTNVISSPLNINNQIYYLAWQNDSQTYALYNDTTDTTNNVTWSLYASNAGGALLYTTTSFAQDVLFTFNASAYPGVNILSIMAINSPLLIKNPFNYMVNLEINNIDFPLKNILSSTTLNWIFFVLICLLALYSTQRTSPYVAIGLVLLSLFASGFGFTTLNMITIGITGLIALFSFMTNKEAI
jgi:hypothetical protein